jgi:hypothetical protein
MSNAVVVHKGRTVTVQANLGVDLTGSVITSEIREEPDRESPLIVAWTVAITDAAAGDITLTLDNSLTTGITATSGYMDLKRTAGGEPLAVFDKPIEVEFRETVTA